MTEDAPLSGAAIPSAEAAQRPCAFPGCPRPAAAPTFSSGRPPAYCEDPSHTAVTAFRERQRRKGAAAGTPPVDDPRPIETATQRAAALRGQVAEVGEHLVTQLRTLLDELGVLGDPEAAAAQIESVTTEAGEQVAAATARAARAERAARSAEAEREQADTAAEEALARLEEVSAELEQTRQAWQTEVGALTAAQAELIQEHQVAIAEAAAVASAQREELQEEHRRALSWAAEERAELVQVHEQAMEQARQAAAAREDALTRRAEEQSRAAEQARREADTARQAAEGEVVAARSLLARAEADADAARTAAAEVAEQERELREVTAQLRTDLAVMRVERDAALADVTRQQVAADQRVHEVRELLTEEVNRLRGEVEDLRRGEPQPDRASQNTSTVGEGGPRTPRSVRKPSSPQGDATS